MSRARRKATEAVSRAVPAPAWVGPTLLGAAAAALLWGCWVCWPRTVDDAFITFRYAQNLVDGLGPVFNPGERVEGYTSPSWLALMAGAIAAGIDPVPASKALGIGASLALLAAVYARLRQVGASAHGAGLAAVLLGSSLVLQLWSVAGLETVAYALLFFLGVTELVRGAPTPHSALWASGLLVAATLTRPQGLAFWGIGLGVVSLSTPHPAPGSVNAARLRIGALYALPGLVILLHFAWRLAYYGALLPNTYYVKTGGGPRMWAQGLAELRSFLSKPSLLIALILAALGALLASRSPLQRRRVGVVAGVAALHLVYVVSVGGDGLHIHRFYVPLLPLLAWLFGLAFVPREGRGVPRWLPPVAALLVVSAGVLSFQRLYQRFVPSLDTVVVPFLEGNAKLGRYLAESRDPDTLVAVAAAGAIPFYSRLPVIDMYGLNDRHIARVPFPDSRGARMMKWDSDYVLSRRPDLIVVNRGYFPAGAPGVEEVLANPRLLIYAPMDLDLMQAVSETHAYRLRPLALPDGSTFFVLERFRDY